MVCLGNICRSPLAEGILRQKAEKSGLWWEVDSAGTNGLHTGEPPHHLSRKVARLNGVDICSQKSRKFSASDFERYDRIYAMAADVIEDMQRIAGPKYDSAKVDLLMNELYPGENRDIPDPWYGTEPGYHEVFKMIDAVCEKMIGKYSSPTGTKRPSRISDKT